MTAGQRSRPKSPNPPPFAALRRRLGIPDDATIEPAPPEPVNGPAVAVPERYHTDTPCAGSFRLVEQEGAHWLARCDRCHAEAMVPARSLDPDIAKHSRLAAAGLPERFSGRFEETTENAPALRALRQWIASQDPADRVASLLPAPVLWGQPGRGKTHLLTAVCRRLIGECDVTVMFRPVRQLLRELQDFDGMADQIWRRAVNVDVLALDDLGAQRGTDWRHDQLADLIDERYQAERPIVLATNYPPAAWEGVMDARTHSRLRGMTFAIELKGPDRREAGQVGQHGQGARDGHGDGDEGAGAQLSATDGRVG